MSAGIPDKRNSSINSLDQSSPDAVVSSASGYSLMVDIEDDNGNDKQPIAHQETKRDEQDSYRQDNFFALRSSILNGQSEFRKKFKEIKLTRQGAQAQGKEIGFNFVLSLDNYCILGFLYKQKILFVDLAGDKSPFKKNLLEEIVWLNKELDNLTVYLSTTVIQPGSTDKDLTRINCMEVNKCFLEEHGVLDAFVQLDVNEAQKREIQDITYFEVDLAKLSLSLQSLQEKIAISDKKETHDEMKFELKDVSSNQVSDSSSDSPQQSNTTDQEQKERKRPTNTVTFTATTSAVLTTPLLDPRSDSTSLVATPSVLPDLTVVQIQSPESKNDVDSMEEKRSVSQYWTHYLMRGSLAGSTPMPSNGQVSLKWISDLKTSYRNSDFTWNVTWPLALLGLLTHDVYEFYHSPLTGFGLDNLNNIFGGLLFTNPNNYWQTGLVSQQNWSNHLGSDLVGSPYYWVGVGAAVGLPLLNRAVNYAYRHYCYRDVEYEELEKFIKKLDKNKRSSSDEKSLENKNNSNFEQPENNDRLYKIFQSSGLLAELADNLDTSEGIYHPINNLPDTKNTLQALQRKSLQTLRERAEKGSVYAKYLLWTLGKGESTAWSVLFWLKTFYVLYAKIRLLELIVQKARGAYEYFNKKNECESDHKVFQYSEEIGDYDCFSCSPQEWLVYYKDAYTSQGCLTGLLARTQTPQNILTKLSTDNNQGLLWHPDITDIDLSLQEIASWLETDFRDFLTKIIQSGIRELNSFNLSSPVYIADWPQDRKIQAFAGFLQQVRVKRFSLNNQGIGPDQIKILVPGMQGNSYELVDWSNTAADDESIIMASTALARNETFIADWRLANSSLSDYGMGQVTLAFQNPALTSIDLTGGLWGDPGCFNLSLALPISRLERVVLDGIALSDSCLTSLGQGASMAPTLQFLSTADCDLGDDEMEVFSPFLPSSSLLEWDVSYNQMTGEGFAIIAQNMPGAPLTILHVGHNNIDQLAIAASYFPYTNLTVIALPGNQFQPSEFITFSQFTPNMTLLEEIDASDNALDSDSVGTFFAVQANTTNQVRRVNFNSNQVDDTVAPNLALFLNSSSNRLTHFFLANNPVTGITGNVLVNTFTQGKGNTTLQVIDLSGSGVDASTVQAMLRSFPGTSIQQFYFNAMQWNSASIQTDLLNLIKAIPQMENLGDPTLSIDQARALARDSGPTTHVQAYGFANNDLNVTTVREACRLAAPMEINVRRLQLDGNNISADFDLLSCQTSSASINRPWTYYIAKAFSFLALPSLGSLMSTSNNAERLTTSNQLLALPAPESTVQNLSNLTATTSETGGSFSAQLILLGLAILVAWVIYRLLAQASNVFGSYRNTFWGSGTSEQNNISQLIANTSSQYPQAKNNNQKPTVEFKH